MTIVGGPLSAVPDWYHAVGTLLALGSGLFIGVSLILQKKGLLDTEPLAAETGNEHAYLKSRTWWLGMLFMAIGELSNLAAYAFSPAIIVTPLGAVSVIVSAILSVFFLNEKLNFSGVCGLILCIIGSTIIVFHGPTSTATQTIPEFYDAVLRPGFICYAIFSAILLVWLVVYIAPLYGKTQPVVYLSITSIGGAFLVNAAQGFGSSIVYTTRHWEDDNQFRYWGFYPLTAFIGLSAVFQIHYLNLSLLYFSNSIVTPVNYVFFASFTIITSAVLYQGFNVPNTVTGLTVILGFLVIVIGVALLFQYNLKLNKLAQQVALQNISQHSDPNDSIVASTVNALNEPATDQDPITMMIESFPFRQTGATRSMTVPAVAMSATFPNRSTPQVHQTGVTKTELKTSPAILEYGSIISDKEFNTSTALLNGSTSKGDGSDPSELEVDLSRSKSNPFP